MAEQRIYHKCETPAFRPCQIVFDYSDSRVGVNWRCWFMDDGEYTHPIVYCPYCGVRLDIDIPPELSHF